MIKYGLFFLVTCLTLGASAQDYPGYGRDSLGPAPQYREKKWFAGGGLALGFGSYTDIDVAPEIGYRLTQGVAVGAAFNFNFISDKTVPGVQQNYTILGGGIFARIYPIRHIFLEVLPEYNSSTQKYKDYTGNAATFSTGVVSLLMGGGYVEQISEGSEFTFGIMYDVLQNPNSPFFGYPVIQGGVDIGF
jgi:hypothetical protein